MAECLTRDGLIRQPGSTSHDYGEAASEAVEAARAQVAAAIGAEPADVVLTSGATEANNLAIFGIAQYYRDTGRHIVTARTEHKSVLDPCRELERRGWRVSYLSPDGDGLIDPSQVAAAIRPDTVLVSIMHVNNEIGVIQDIAAIAAHLRRAGTARLHVDAAQSVGKCDLDFGALGVDLMSVSAHKAYGPKGAGALIVSRRRGARLTPLLHGGGQEGMLRPGTVATHQAVGMGAAFMLASEARARECVRIAALGERLWCSLQRLGGVLRNGGGGAVGAACAECLLRGGGRRKPGRGGATAPRRLDRFRVHVSDAGAFVRAARAGPRRSPCGEQSALQPRPLHQRARHRHRCGRRHRGGSAAAPDRRK